MSGLDHEFWRHDCRGAGLSHTHYVHLGDPTHMRCPCRDCGLTPERWVALVDPDSLPLALTQQDGCSYAHGQWVRFMHNGSLATCPGCETALEPKMATGVLSGPPWGSGRGWVNPRTRMKWKAIAYRAMRDDEMTLPPMSSYK